MRRVQCVELVERATDYLEGSLGADDAIGLGDHLLGCSGCQAYVGQFRAVLRLLSDAPPERMSHDLESSLLAKYREWSPSVTL